MVKIFSIKDDQKGNRTFSFLGIKYTKNKKIAEQQILRDTIDELKTKINNLNYQNMFLQLSILRNMKKTFFHLSAFTLHNAGDNNLVLAMQDSINKILPEGQKISFLNKRVRDKLNNEDIFLLNNSQGIIIGGGGLFLKDTNPNEISGWQFPISIEQISEINVPVIMLSVGYNRFRNQEDIEPYFYNNINAFVEKAKFVGLRNTGSIRALKKYLREDLHKKLVFHPCPTTILSKIYDIPKMKKREFIALECAFDRSELRYGSKKEEILTSIANVIKILSKNFEIKYYSHMERDLEMLPYLDKQNVDYKVVRLNKSINQNDFIDYYSTPALVMGMRGHAQMIPFGCGTPILSIISHDKLAWFLEDIHHPEWGVDVLDSDFEAKLLQTALKITSNIKIIEEQIEEEKNRLYEITLDNYKKCFLD